MDIGSPFENYWQASQASGFVERNKLTAAVVDVWPVASRLSSGQFAWQGGSVGNTWSDASLPRVHYMELRRPMLGGFGKEVQRLAL